MPFKIENCTDADLPKILKLYDAARQLQTERKMVVWPSFPESLLQNEIKELRQWKLIVDNEIACNWAITFEDKEIWEARDNNDSIYIHRICTNPDFRGHRYIDQIVDWATDYARLKAKRFIRLDTLGNNLKLITHYTSAGFNFLGMHKLHHTSTLPKHYQDEPNCCLFEIDLANA